jgi:hypothetical protein
MRQNRKCPPNLAAMLWRARAWYQAGMLEQSDASRAKILAVEPNHIDAIYLPCKPEVAACRRRWQTSIEY